MVVLNPASHVIVFEGFFSRQKLAEKTASEKTTLSTLYKGN